MGIPRRAGGQANTCLLQQYRCGRAPIGVKQDDVVIDGGGCWGDTAFYFALTLNLGYRFYLGHFTIHAEETVLLARSNS